MDIALTINANPASVVAVCATIGIIIIGAMFAHMMSR